MSRLRLHAAVGCVSIRWPLGHGIDRPFRQPATYRPVETYHRSVHVTQIGLSWTLLSGARYIEASSEKKEVPRPDAQDYTRPG